MLTKIDICSMALLKLGESPIQSFSDKTAAATIARTLYDITVDSLLAAHPWRFACRKIRLNRDKYGDFLVPPNVLRIIQCDGDVIGDKILSNAPNLAIRAICHVPTETFPGFFASLVATKLAMDFCVPLTGDQTVFRMMAALYETELKNAKFIDSTMSPGTSINNFSLIDARF